ncbi:MAG TPA: HD domain-containing phosphohydrolase [Terriglobales bacterium]|nr:HD domain-containing phosphohydrolase [Terriglobales bacterium]
MTDAVPGGAMRASEEGGRLLELGPRLLVRFSAMLRTARTHDVSNQAFQRQLQEFLQILLETLEEEDEVALVAVAGYFYLNGVRLRASAALLSMYHALIEEFERRGLGGMRFLHGVGAAEMERFLQLFQAAEDPALAERLAEAVIEASVEHVVIVPAADLDKEDLTRELDEKMDVSSERGRAKKVFWRAVLGSKRIVVRAAQTGRPDLRQAKRLVQPVVDSIMKNEYSIVGLTALKEHDEYTYAHCVNVSVLSISMGQALGLPRQALADLGVAGLLHDIGKVAVPGDVLRKPDKLNSDEWGVIRRHPLEGVKMMFRMPGLSSLTLDAMRVSLEHHLNFDLTGYPEIEHEWAQATMTRIVALADCFDAMTAHRAYHKRPRTPFEGLQYLLGPARVQFDPAVLWSLVRTVGLYPAGSMLLTGSNHVVLAVSPNPRDLRRPHCRVLVRPDGTPVPEDIEEPWDPMSDEESVLRVLRPEETTLDAQELLAA